MLLENYEEFLLVTFPHVILIEVLMKRWRSNYMSLQPLFFEPVFKERIWGGEQLKSFGYELPSTQTGECWAFEIGRASWRERV